MVKNEIRSIEMAASGHKKIEWVKNNMPLLNELEREFAQTRPFEGLRI